MGPESQQKVKTEGTIEIEPTNSTENVTVDEIVESATRSGGQAQTWAAQPIEKAQKEKLDFDALKIFFVLALLTALMAVVLKFSF